MPLSSHISQLTRHLGQQIWRGSFSLRGELRRAVILISAFSTRGQMALSSHISQLTRHLGQQIWRGGFFLSQGRVEAGAIFMNSGDNIYTAPGPTGLTRWLLSSSGDSCIDAGAGFKENRGKYGQGAWEIRFEAGIWLDRGQYVSWFWNRRSFNEESFIRHGFSQCTIWLNFPPGWTMTRHSV